MPVFSSATTLSNAEKEIIIPITNNELKLNEKQEKDVIEYGKTLQQKLKSVSKANYEDVLIEYLQQNKSIMDNILEDTINHKLLKDFGQDVKNLKETKKEIIVSIDKEAINKETYAYVIDEQTTLAITPIGVVLEVFGKGPDIDTNVNGFTLTSDETTLLTRAQNATNGYADYKCYRSGSKVATVHVSSNFWYNGQKAWYKDGHTGYIEIHEENWEQYGSGDIYRTQYETSCRAAYNGKIKTEIEFLHVLPLTVETRLLEAAVTCSKTGSFTTSYEDYIVSN